MKPTQLAWALVGAPITGMVCRASAIAAVRLLSVATLPPALRPRTNVETIFVGPPRRMHWGHRASSLSAPPAASRQLHRQLQLELPCGPEQRRGFAFP